jgi:uncharacterized membrane protein
MLTLIKGFTGKPSHAPLTDVSIGAYTVGVLMLIAGYCGLEEAAMAKGALLAISGGLIVAIPTSLTGLLDWFDLGKGSRARTLANYHLSVMILATLCFAATWLLQRRGYLDSEVTTNGLIAGCVALGLLTLGGTMGGALNYVYGVRVVKRDVPIMDALIPGRLEAPASTKAAAPAPAPAPAAAPSGEAPYVADAPAAPKPAPAAAAAAQPVSYGDGGGPSAADAFATSLADYEAYITSGQGRA